jgi:FAD/FMN-containing dehydrogenase
MTATEPTPLEARLAQYRPFRNWCGSQSCVPAYTMTAQTEQDVIDTVRFARRRNLAVRAIGSGLSFSPVCQTGGVLLDVSALSGITGLDGANHRVRVLAGTKVWKLAELLWGAGYSLANQGALDAQGIVGAISTGTHGTGTELGCLASFVRWVRLVDGAGDVIEIGEDNPDWLHAAQVSIGMLGVLLEVELEVVPRFYLAEEVAYPGWDESMSHWSDAFENRHYAAMWFPHDGSPDVYGIPTPDGEAMGDRVFEARCNVIDVEDESQLVETFGTRRNRAYTIMSLGGGLMPPLYHELEYMVPRELGQEAAAAVRALIQQRHPEHLYPMYIRFVAGDRAFLSPFYMRDSVALSIGGSPEHEYWPVFKDIDRLLADSFAARAHWGKNHLMTRDRVREVYPRYDDFVRVRRELDPHGTFLNDHTRALFD